MISALEAILRRPRSVLTLMTVMVLGGLLAYIAIPKEANPDIDVPIFYISVGQQGVSPEDAERLLVRPLETRLRGLDGLKEITGIASEGHAGILLEFDVDFDKDAALADVRAKVDEAKAELPADADEPRIVETNFSLVPTITVALSGNVPERTLFSLARDLQDRIEAIPTVLEARLAGHREELLEVVIDTVRLESYDISQAELVQAINNNNRLVAAGALDQGSGRFNVKVPGLFENAADVMSLPVKVSGEGVVTLGDVAEVRRTFMDPTSFTRVNGQPAISLEVVKRLGTNVIENNMAVRDVVAEATPDWPESVNIDFLLDQSSFIEDVLGSLESSIMTAIALVMIVVVAALGLRSALLVGFAIPTSFLIGFLTLSIMGTTVNMMVLFGLVLTVGILVDSAIIMVEYADRKMAEGMHRREAYIRAARLMFWPLVSSTATTLVAFLPMLLWPGVAGEFMSYLPITVIIVLMASLLTAMVFLPVIGGIFGKSGADHAEAETAKRLSGAAALDPVDIQGLTGVYVRTIAVLSRHPAKVIVAMLIGIAAIIYTFAQNPTGVTFFIDEEPDQAVILISARGNLSVVEQRDLVGEVEREVLQVDGIRNVIMKSGAGTPGSEQFGVQDKPMDAIGQLTLEFEEFSKRRRAALIFEEIRSRTADIPGILVETRKIEGGPPTGKDIRLQITGTNYTSVQEATARVRTHFDTGITDIRDVEDGRPLPGIEWRLSVDRAEAGRFGADIATVGSMIQLVTNGVLVGKYRPDDSDDEVDIRLRFPAEERSLDALDTLNVSTANGFVPIRNFVTREAQPQVSSITRRDGRYAMDVKANVAPDILPDDKVREVQAWLGQQDWPAGIQFRFRGADEDQRESGAFLAQAMLGALFLMFVILVTQFNSFYQTALTLSTVVMSGVGVIIGLIVTGQPFSIIMTGTGVVALAGIVVNNAIVLIDTFNRFRQDGVPHRDAMLKTAAQRLRPVMLTTVTTIMGLVPMALQLTLNFVDRSVVMGGITSGWWVQLSTAVIFGLGFATLLTLVFVPVMLTAPAMWKESLSEFRARLPRRRRPAANVPALREDTLPVPYREAAE